MWTRSRGRSGGRRGNRGRGGPFRGARGSYHDKPTRPYGRPYGEKKTFDRTPVFKNHGQIEKLTEHDIGITEYLNTSAAGFNGILKARYSDFHVNEINLQGQIAKLTDMSIPVDPEPEKIEEDDEGVVNRYRIEQLPTETWDKIHKIVQSNNRSDLVEIDVTSITKEERTKIHEAVKIVFGHKIVGSTITKEDKKYITFKKYNKNDKIDNREKWPAARGGEYVYFLLHKEFIDTIEANIQISESLQMRPASFCYAGVKDRRAKTTQWFCVRKVDPAKLVDRTKGLKNICLGNFCYKKEILKLGQLQGNRFRIAVREVSADEDVINKALEALRDNGFVNYYGLQRFGNSKDVPTHEIGIQLLRGNWKEAVNLILKPRKFEQHNDIATAKLIYEDTKDASRAYSRLKKNRSRCIEGRLLGGLAKGQPNDFVNALETVPRNMRLLYIHAYQSLVWNRMVSRRLKEFGMKPIVGDIIVEGELNGSDPFWETPEEAANADKEEADVEIEAQKEMVKQQIKVKILTESDLPNYTIYDIVLPLPGYDISYPANVVKDWYKEILDKDGLSLEMPKQKVKTYTLSGAYRKILERVTNISWKIMGYANAIDNLIRSDYEELKGIPEPKHEPDGKFKALITDFCLSSSCYATMALREMMKSTTITEPYPSIYRSKEPNSSKATSVDAKPMKKENEANSTTEVANKNIDSPKKESIEKETNDGNTDLKSETSKSETEVVEVKMESENNVNQTETKNSEKETEKSGISTQEIDNAKKAFIRKEIEELEDEIWSVMNEDCKNLPGGKRKMQNTTETDPKKIKSDTENTNM